MMAPAGSVTWPVPPSMPSVSAASAATPRQAVERQGQRQRVLLVAPAAPLRVAHRHRQLAAADDGDPAAGGLGLARQRGMGAAPPRAPRRSARRPDRPPRSPDALPPTRPPASAAAGVAMMRYSALAKAGSPGLGVSLAGSASAASTAGGRVRPRACMAGRRRASTARASASVVGSGTVGPEPMVAGSSPGTSEMASVSMRRRRGLAQPAALDARDVAAHGVHLVDVGAALEQPARQPGLVGEREAGGGRGPECGGAARQQHEHEVALPWPSPPAPGCARPRARCRHRASGAAPRRCRSTLGARRRSASGVPCGAVVKPVTRSRTPRLR